MTRKTNLAIDEDLLARAQAILSTSTLQETVEKAFQEVIRSQARREEVRALSRGEGSDLADPQVMAGAWRH